MECCFNASHLLESPPGCLIRVTSPGVYKNRVNSLDIERCPFNSYKHCYSTQEGDPATIFDDKSSEGVRTCD